MLYRPIPRNVVLMLKLDSLQLNYEITYILQERYASHILYLKLRRFYGTNGKINKIK